MRKRRLLANTISSLVFQISTIICGFVLPRLILANFGSEVNGLVNSLTQFLSFIGLLEMGVGAVIQSSLYKPLAEKDSIQISKVLVSGQKFFNKIGSCLCIYVVLLICIYPYISNQKFGFVYTATLIIAMSISSFAQYYFGIINRLLLTADQKGYISYNAQTITLILNNIACFILIKAGASIQIVKLITSFIYILRPMALFLYVRKNYSIDWKIEYQEEPIKQKWNGVAQHISAAVLDGTDNIVLTLFSSLSNVSIYSVYYLVVSGIKQLLLSMTNGIQSLLGEMWAKRELKELKKFFGYIEWTLHTGTILMFSITSLLIVPFIQVYTKGIYDANYNQPLFATLMVMANAGHCLRLPYQLMILAGGHYKQTQNNYINAAILNIIISVLAVKKFGLIGVAIGTLIAMLYQTIWMAKYVSKNLVCWPFKTFTKQLFVDIITMSLTIFVVKMPIWGVIFKLQTIGYLQWIFLAIKVSMVSIAVFVVINLIFYKKYVIGIVKKISMVFKNKWSGSKNKTINKHI